jgi:hypothetical protein
MLEAVALLRGGAATSVVLAVAEDRLPRPLDRYSDHDALALAFCLDLEPGARAHGTLSLPERVEGSATLPEVPRAELAKNPTAWGLPLLHALAASEPATVALSAGPRPWAMNVRPGGGAPA